MERSTRSSLICSYRHCRQFRCSWQEMPPLSLLSHRPAAVVATAAAASAFLFLEIVWDLRCWKWETELSWLSSPRYGSRQHSLMAPFAFPPTAFSLLSRTAFSLPLLLLPPPVVAAFALLLPTQPLLLLSPMLFCFSFAAAAATAAAAAAAATATTATVAVTLCRIENWVVDLPCIAVWQQQTQKSICEASYFLCLCLCLYLWQSSGITHYLYCC